jgi:hypothetical protein
MRFGEKLRSADPAKGKQQRRLAARDKGRGRNYQERVGRRDFDLGITAQPYSTISRIRR